MTHPHSTILELLAVQYKIKAKLTRLAGENENYLVESDQHMAYVLKLADEDTRSGMIEIEHLAVESLIKADLGLSLPRIIPTLDKKIEAKFRDTNNREIRARLLSFVSGAAWCTDAPAPKERLKNLGATIARMTHAMSNIRHPDLARTHPWDLEKADQHRASIELIQDPYHRGILEQVFLAFSAIVQPLLPELPRGPIHGDINDDNVLILGPRVAGILDFGDCLDNPLVNELAIGLAYHTLDEPDPLGAGAQIIKAYHEKRPLSQNELKVIFPLVCTRLAVSVIISAQRRKLNPGRDSWFVSEKRAWEKLEYYSKFSPAEAANILAAHTKIRPYPDPGCTHDELAQKRKSCIGPCISLAYDRPLRMVEGKAQFLHEASGRPFLDLYNNVCHVGHCHPHMVAAGQAQMAKLNTNTRYLYDSLMVYAQRLTATLPPSLDTCFFVNSGSEANELALRMAKTVTGQSDLLVVDNAYHGHTQAMIHISPYKFMDKGGKGRPESWVHVVPVADGFRGKYRRKDKSAGTAYGDEVGKIIEQLDRPIAGFITESLLSCGGQVIPPENYFKTAFAHVRNAGGLCICDEVQTGFGRIGSHFWAFEAQDVVPDIVVMGKPIGNGHPMSALVTTAKIAQTFANGMEFFATFGDNPVSCAIGMAVLDVIENQALQKNAADVGQFLLSQLLPLMDRHPLIGDIRGAGLFMGIELVKDRETLAPAAKEAAFVVNRLRDQGILLGTDGPFSNVIKIKPPMVITRADAAMFVRVLDQVLEALD
ncbi:MAG: aminotransferase class III-fold pyridoxal phosphate-dependent enzyme [Desulfobacter sp.]|nr:MAG: aminotransferase class III-fold pyridoxal phosphate-dependent enzyme [Desulfobacter sp.]